MLRGRGKIEHGCTAIGWHCMLCMNAMMLSSTILASHTRTHTLSLSLSHSPTRGGGGGGDAAKDRCRATTLWCPTNHTSRITCVIVVALVTDLVWLDFIRASGVSRVPSSQSTGVSIASQIPPGSYPYAKPQKLLVRPPSPTGAGQGISACPTSDHLCKLDARTLSHAVQGSGT